jgi:hypothetical protein
MRGEHTDCAQERDKCERQSDDVEEIQYRRQKVGQCFSQSLRLRGKCIHGFVLLLLHAQHQLVGTRRENCNGEERELHVAILRRLRWCRNGRPSSLRLPASTDAGTGVTRTYAPFRICLPDDDEHNPQDEVKRADHCSPYEPLGRSARPYSRVPYPASAVLCIHESASRNQSCFISGQHLALRVIPRRDCPHTGWRLSTAGTETKTMAPTRGGKTAPSRVGRISTAPTASVLSATPSDF